MKKYFLLLTFIAAGFPAFAIDHGSIMGNDLPLYLIRNGVAGLGGPVEGVFDFKAVTIGTKTWVWTNLSEKNLNGNNWSSRIRFWSPAIQESNLSNRIAGTQQTYGIIGIPDINPCEHPVNSCEITFLQEIDEVFYETDTIVYNYTQHSAGEDDQTQPILDAPAVISQTDRQLRLSLSATDDSGNFFYYIEDAESKFVEVSFSSEAVLHLDTDKTYRFSIYAVDFSGNQSDARLISVSPADIRNGSDFYIIYMDAESEAILETKVKEKSMLREIWPMDETMEEVERTGENAWGVSATWVALDVAEGATDIGWNGGAIVAGPEDGKALDLTAITNNPNDYYFHFAIKSPVDQPAAGWTLILYSDGDSGDTVKYYIGPDTVKSALGLPRLGDYAHDGQWHHFEIPVSQLVSKGYKWNGTVDARQYLLGFQSPANIPGTQLNLDAIFFYKKQGGLTWSPPGGTAFTEGTAQAVSFKLDSRSLNELKIECTSNDFINDAFVKLELNGVEVTGRWQPVIANPATGAQKYLITVPASEVHGWAEGAVLGLNLGYAIGRNYVNDNKVITEDENVGKPILHKIGTGVDILLNLPAVEINALSAYPNPSGGMLYINGIDDAVAVRILDLMGKTVLSRVLSKAEIDVSGLSPGVYYLKIKNQTVKFIKKR